MSGIASSSDEQLLAALRKHIKSGGSMRQHRAAARALLREARDAIGKQSAERRREIGQIERQLDAAHGRPAVRRVELSLDLPDLAPPLRRLLADGVARLAQQRARRRAVLAHRAAALDVLAERGEELLVTAACNAAHVAVARLVRVRGRVGGGLG